MIISAEENMEITTELRALIAVVATALLLITLETAGGRRPFLARTPAAGRAASSRPALAPFSADSRPVPEHSPSR
ncbi:MAG: hypothetical protein ACHQ49_03175 [Elusimicrobiota bacterium]